MAWSPSWAAAGSAAVCADDRHAVVPQSAAKQTYAADHTHPCMRAGRFGSTTNG